ncbi:hypothetical protein EJ08DRAFT_714397 [Tothia fuscella]|uniref:Uncharacterized protein n=1 Tax=Tothia fuscella TaxID=1048955 RepID=A0A9P4TYJ3_9PEZI|nr:hypothetical protein EJ08DRAFT_714397 [Tothia fuscella]
MTDSTLARIGMDVHTLQLLGDVVAYHIRVIADIEERITTIEQKTRGIKTLGKGVQLALEGFPLLYGEKNLLCWLPEKECEKRLRKFTIKSPSLERRDYGFRCQRRELKMSKDYWTRKLKAVTEFIARRLKEKEENALIKVRDDSGDRDLRRINRAFRISYDEAKASIRKQDSKEPVVKAKRKRDKKEEVEDEPGVKKPRR